MASKKQKKSEMIVFAAEPDLVIAFDKYCEELGVARSFLIRKLMKDELNRIENNKIEKPTLLLA